MHATIVAYLYLPLLNTSAIDCLLQPSEGLYDDTDSISSDVGWEDKMSPRAKRIL